MSTNLEIMKLLRQYINALKEAIEEFTNITKRKRKKKIGESYHFQFYYEYITKTTN